MKTELTEREKIFVKEYAVHGKASYAAKQAGYSAASDKALSVSANRLLKRDRVKQAIEELGREIANREKQVLTAADVSEVVVDRNYLTNEAVATYKDAKDDKQHGVRIQALKLLAELHHLVETPDNSKQQFNFVMELVSEPKLINGRATDQANSGFGSAQARSLIDDAETV